MAVQAAQDAGLLAALHVEGGLDAWKRARKARSAQLAGRKAAANCAVSVNSRSAATLPSLMVKTWIHLAATLRPVFLMVQA